MRFGVLMAAVIVVLTFGIAEAPEQLSSDVFFVRIPERSRAEKLYDFCVEAQQSGRSCL